MGARRVQSYLLHVGRYILRVSPDSCRDGRSEFRQPMSMAKTPLASFSKDDCFGGRTFGFYSTGIQVPSQKVIGDTVM